MDLFGSLTRENTVNASKPEDCPLSQRSSLEAEHCPPLAYLRPDSGLFPRHRPPHHPTTLGLLVCPCVPAAAGLCTHRLQAQTGGPTLPSPAGLVGSLSPSFRRWLQTFSSRSPRPPTPPSLRAVTCTPFLRDAGGDAVCAGGLPSSRPATFPVAPPPRPIGCAEGTYPALANEVREAAASGRESWSPGCWSPSGDSLLCAAWGRLGQSDNQTHSLRSASFSSPRWVTPALSEKCT